MIGPKSAPTAPVPRFWATKSNKRMRHVKGTMADCIDGRATASPSMALSTEMARGHRPVAVEQGRADDHGQGDPGDTFRVLHAHRSGTTARRAKMPPSPWLSARMMKVRYLTVTTMVRDQKISDRSP